MPEGYDSVCFPASGESTRLRKILEKEQDQTAPEDDSAAETSLDATDPVQNNFRYLLTDSKQVLPLYHLTFQAKDESLEEAGQGGPSDEAALQQAIQALSAVPGSEKAIELLKSQAAAASHKYGVSEYGQPYEFYDPVLQVPVCVHMKMIGTHSKGEAANHKLIPIPDAYKDAMAASNEEDTILIERQKMIKDQLARVDERVREVKQNASQIEESIYQLLQEALVQLQEESQKKIMMLTSEEMELRRLLRDCQQAESFLRTEQSNLKPLPFLSSWVKHKQLLSEKFYSVPFANSDVRVKSDIKLVGRVQVVLAEGPDEFSAPPVSQGDPSLPPATQMSGTGTVNSAMSASEFWTDTLRQKRESVAPSPAGQTPQVGGASYASPAPNRMSMSGSGADGQLLSMVVEPALTLVKSLCTVVDIQDADELAQALVRIFESQGNTLALIKSSITREVRATETANLLLRSNSMATKMMTSYSQMIGVPYLRVVLCPIVDQICRDPLRYEVDAQRLGNDFDVSSNFRNLVSACQNLLDTIRGTLDRCPPAFRHICSHLHNEVQRRFPDRRHTAIGGFIFLRFFCPALVSPDSFGLMEVAPSREARHVLTLIAKTMVNMANGIPFGTKEPAMKEMNDFILQNLKQVSDFFDDLAQVPPAMMEFSQQTSIPVEAKIGCLSVVQRHVKRHQERLREILRTENFAMQEFEATLSAPDIAPSLGASRSPSRFGY